MKVKAFQKIVSEYSSGVARILLSFSLDDLSLFLGKAESIWEREQKFVSQNTDGGESLGGIFPGIQVCIWAELYSKEPNFVSWDSW